MARWIALGLGIVVVGLIVFIVGPDRTAADSQDDRIAALEQRVAMLEQRAVPAAINLQCRNGVIEGQASDAGSVGYFTRVRLAWQSKTTPANVNNPLVNGDVGQATFQHCTVTDSTP